MKATYLFIFFLPLSTNAQNIQGWQAENPTVTLMQRGIYESLSAKEQSLLGNDILLFNDSPEELSGQLKSKNPSDNNTEGTVGDAVKVWVATHPDVLIVTASQAASASPEFRQIMTDHNALVLAGEKVTMSDIQNYQY